jgi:hypothetical protein
MIAGGNWWRTNEIVVEGLDHLLRIDRPDAPDHPGAEIFLDLVD